MHAEWTKFRTVRGWIIAMIVAILASVALGLLAPASDSSGCQASGGGGPQSGAACGGAPSFILGPGGEPVTDSFYFVHQPLAGDGSITVRLTSLTGGSPRIQPWTKAGVIIKQNQNPGSAYAAMMVTHDHGVRMQWNYTGDTAGLSGAIGPANPRWLRLTRAGDVITGYDSADGTHWTQVGTVTLSGLPATVQAGLRASWTGEYFGAGQGSGTGTGKYHQAGGQFTVTGSGDIAPVTAGHGGSADSAQLINNILIGDVRGADRHRGRSRHVHHQRVPAQAHPHHAGGEPAARPGARGEGGRDRRGLVRGRRDRRRRRAGARHEDNRLARHMFPTPLTTEVRLVIGTGLLVAVAAVLILSVGAMVRRSAATIAIAIVVFVVPYFLSVTAVLPIGVDDWLLRVTPAAGYAIQGAYPEYAQVAAIYSAANGYYPLEPWAGFAVLCAWAALALAGAVYLLRRRDA